MTDAVEKKSIIDPKYLAKYKGKAKDWLSTFIDGQVKTVPMKEKTTKTEVDGETIVKTEMVSGGKSVLDLNKLFVLCKRNGIATADMEAQRDRKNAAGRIRMTLGNTLRAESKHRHGLFDLEGDWNAASDEYLGDAVRTKEKDGTKIVVTKATVTEGAEPEA